MNSRDNMRNGIFSAQGSKDSAVLFVAGDNKMKDHTNRTNTFRRAYKMFMALLIALTMMISSAVPGVSAFAANNNDTVRVATYDQLQEAQEETKGVKEIVVDPQAAVDEGEVVSAGAVKLNGAKDTADLSSGEISGNRADTAGVYVSEGSELSTDKKFIIDENEIYYEKNEGEPAKDEKPSSDDAVECREGTYTVETKDGTVITLNGLLPVNASVEAYPVDVEIDNEDVICAYDIYIYTEDGRVFEPENGDTVSVSFTVPSFEEEKDSNYSVYYVPDKGEPEKISDAVVEEDTITFDAEHLSVYAWTATGNLGTVYLDGTYGNDNYNGSRADRPVKTIEKALSLVGQNGTIYITGTVTVANDQTWTSVKDGNDGKVTIQRYANFKNQPLITVNGGGNLTLENITIDGGSEAASGEVTSPYYPYGSASAPLIYVKNEGKLNLNSGSILQNNANKASSSRSDTLNGYDGQGGAVYCAGTLILDNGTIRGCQARSGGGIYLEGSNSSNRATMTMYSGLIDDNYSRDDYSGSSTTQHKNAGGGIYIGKYVDMTMYSGTISNNQASKEGGGISMNWLNEHKGSPSSVEWSDDYYSTFTMHGGTFDGNYSRGMGGGLNIGAAMIATVSGGEFINNSAYGINPQYSTTSHVFSGGGIYVGAAQMYEMYGYDGYVGKAGKLIIHRLVVTENRAYDGGGYAGCPTGNSKVLELYGKNDGTAIYNNKASRSSNYPTNEMAQSMEAEIPLSMPKTALGGGSYSWSYQGSYSGNNFKAWDNDLSKNSKTIKDIYDNKLYTTMISYNYGYYGGGIGNNGEIQMGLGESKTFVAAVKTWKNDNSDVRPRYITLQLMRSVDGGPYNEYGSPVVVRPTSSDRLKDTWPVYYFDDLPAESGVNNGNHKYTYTVKETSVPGYYTATTATSNNGETVTITNTYNPPIELYKAEGTSSNGGVHIDTQNTKYLEGAEFALYKAKIGAPTAGKIFVENSRGESSGDNNKLIKPVNVYNKNDIKDREAIVSDSQGKIAINDVDPGVYLLFETKAPAGYERAKSPWLIHISKTGKTTVVAVPESKDGKYIAENSSEITESYNSAGETYAERVNSLSSWVVKKWWLKEWFDVTATSDNVSDGKSIEDVLMDGSLEGRTLSEDKILTNAPIQLVKKDEEKTTPLAGAKFEVWGAQVEQVGSEWKLIKGTKLSSHGDYTTDNTGAIDISKSINFARYNGNGWGTAPGTKISELSDTNVLMLFETESPKWRKTPSTAPWLVIYDQKTGSVTVKQYKDRYSTDAQPWSYNDFRNNDITDGILTNDFVDIKLTKVGSESDSAKIEGAKFDLYKVETGTGEDGSNTVPTYYSNYSDSAWKIGSVESGEDGIIDLTALIKNVNGINSATGDKYFILKETGFTDAADAEKYSIPNAPWLIVVSPNGTVVAKVHEKANADGYEGWDTYQGNNGIWKHWHQSKFTDVNATNKTEIVNYWKPVEIDKVDSATKEGVDGAEFELYEVEARDHLGVRNSEHDTEKVAPVNATTIVSKNGGKIKLPITKPGIYFLFETKAPDKYVRAKSPWLVRVDENKNIKIVAITPEEEGNCGYYVPDAPNGKKYPWGANLYPTTRGELNEWVINKWWKKGWYNLASTTFTHSQSDAQPIDNPQFAWASTAGSSFVTANKIPNVKIDIKLTKVARGKGVTVSESGEGVNKKQTVSTSSGAEYLKGTKFDIYKADDSWEKDGGKLNNSPIIAGNRGIVELGALVEGKYLLYETEASDPKYIAPSKPWRITVTNSIEGLSVKIEEPNYTGDTDYIESATTEDSADENVITNIEKYDLPNAGGMGTYWFMIIGAMMMGFALTAGFTKMNLLKLLRR